MGVCNYSRCRTNLKYGYRMGASDIFRCSRHKGRRVANLEKTWTTVVLGENGKTYRTMVIVSPVLPMAIVAFNLYVLSADNLPILIVVTVLAISSVFIYQCYEVYKFLRLASRTVKDVSIDESGDITVNVFSNKKINSKIGEYSFKQDFDRSIVPHSKKLFPDDKVHGVLIVDDEQYYLSGTIGGVEEMYNLLGRYSS